MGNLGRPRKRQFGPGRDGRPADDLEVLIGEDAGGDRTTAELLHVLAPSPADECSVGL
jgi:hypothetical protein